MIKISLEKLAKKKGIKLPPKEELNYTICPQCLGGGHEIVLYIPSDPPRMINALKKLPRSNKICSLCKGKCIVSPEIKEEYLKAKR